MKRIIVDDLMEMKGVDEEDEWIGAVIGRLPPRIGASPSINRFPLLDLSFSHSHHQFMIIETKIHQYEPLCPMSNIHTSFQRSQARIC
jgi:hypothetical protein